MICTECFRQTDDNPPSLIEGLTAAMIFDLCSHWLCRDCLDRQDELLAEAPPPEPEPGAAQ